MAGGTSAGSSGFRGIVMLGMNPDGPWSGKLLMFTVAGETEGVIIVCFDKLRLTGPSMWIVAIKAVNPGIKMATLLKVEPLLMLGFGMGLRISPSSRFKLVITG